MSKNKILDAAQTLFMEYGFDGTSVRSIAQKAEVNVAMISYYFGSKENLLEAIIERSTTYTRSQIEDIHKQGSDPVVMIQSTIDLYVDKIYKNRQFHSLIHQELAYEQRPELHDRIIKLLQGNWSVIKDVINLGQNQGVFRTDIDINLTLMTLFGSISQCSKTRIVRALEANEESQGEEFSNRIKIHLKNLILDHLLVR